MRKVKIDLVAFDYTLWVIFGSAADALRFARFKFEDDTIPPDFLMGRRGCCLYRAGYVPIIWLPAIPRTPREHAILAHEALHAVAHVLRWAHVPLTEDTEEVYGHLLAAIVAAALERAHA